MNIGSKIKKLRKSNQLTQSDLGEKIGKSTITIRKYESGDITPPIDVINKIANAFGVAPSILLKYDKTLSEKLIDALEYPLIKLYGVTDTLEILSDKLKIDYDLLNNSINKNIEFPIDIQIKLLEFLFKIDYHQCMKLIDDNEKEFLQVPNLKNILQKIFTKKIFELEDASFEMFKKYLLTTFGDKIKEFSNDDDLKEIQEETNKYLEFALYKMEKKYYGEDDEDD